MTFARPGGVLDVARARRSKAWTAARTPAVRTTTPRVFPDSHQRGYITTSDPSREPEKRRRAACGEPAFAALSAGLKKGLRKAINEGTVRDSPAPLDAYAEREQGTSAPAEARTRRKRILFVDDEPDLLDSLRDALRKYRKVWRISFATGGEAALANLASEPTDVIVCDMQMPGMDGATLLSDVQDRHPDTIRIVLSGYANPLVVARAATAAHRFLAKPCNLEELGLLIERSCALHDMTKEAEVYRLTAAATSLPSRPGLYLDIAQVIADPTTGPDDIARVIERDTAMTAKVLQLANSAFFGHGRTVTRVREAVVYLGADTIKSLTLTAEAFGKLRPSGIDAFAFNEFQRHATLVARIAARLLPEGAAQQEAVTAALLHDIGKLVLIADDPQRWQRMGEEGARRQRSVYELEKEQEGVTHAATGAYLLTLWGLPAGVVDAVAHHHEPSGVAALDLDPVGAVHIANALAHEVRPGDAGGPPASQIDQDYIERLELEPRLERWRQLASRWAT